MISDLHLGESLGGKSADTLRLERELIGFLDHHRAGPRRWRLVVNGDMLEMSALAILPSDLGLDEAGLHPHEQQYGLGSRADSAVVKLLLVIDHHAEVFDAFGRFLAAGHLVSIVIGNHDIELHWPQVQQLLTDALIERAARFGAAPEQAREAVSFHPWFFFEQGMAWIEHGHQYDPYCSFEEPLEPATDETEIDPNLGGLLPRYVGPQFGDAIHDAWNRSFFGYLDFWFHQGRTRLAGIVRAYVDVCRRMIEHWRARVPARLEARKQRARVRLARIAERLGLPEELLAELAGLAKAPVSVDLRRILQALMVDRLALLVLGPWVLLGPAAVLPWDWLPYGVAASSVPLSIGLWFALLAREPVDPTESMRLSARRIRERMHVPFVVMGHSHRPLSDLDAAGGYLNTGHWVPNDPAAFTHVRIERSDGKVRAVLCQWRDGVSRVYDALHSRRAPAGPTTT